MAYQNEAPITGAFGIQIKAVFEPAKSVSRKRRAQMLMGYEKPTIKPDADNICKAVLDALNKVAFEDDKNCVAINCTKTYGEEEHLEIILTYEEEVTFDGCA